ncbi:hypothetical protein MKW98_025925 [Papaver atlanticum]|uniref:Uncharacterized protein n=1 Tax=Papaver atlanticum TaxID=357466 RepID=A0AAD4SID7_9MAGN|nr:hypothetical protein MKW98_025925 [Papaver atlanticum]
MDMFCKSVRETDTSFPFDCLLFDLDDTLYSSNTGIGAALKTNIDDFLVEKFGYSSDKASSLRIELFKTYGSTLAGLRALGYDIDADDYHSYVHGKLPYELINPDIQLRDLIRSIPQRKLIFTNSDRNHAVKVLEKLGLEGCFEQIICFESINPNLTESNDPRAYPVCLKPSIDAMKIAIDIANIDPRRTLFLDDNVHNIASGKSVGLHTVLVGKAIRTKEADYAVENIVNLHRMVPHIWLKNTATSSDGADKRMSRTRSRTDIEATISNATAVGA